MRNPFWPLTRHMTEDGTTGNAHESAGAWNCSCASQESAIIGTSSQMNSAIGN